MKSDVCNPGVEEISTQNHGVQSPPSTNTPELCSEFPSVPPTEALRAVELGSGALSTAELEAAIDNAALWLHTADTREQRCGALRVLETLVRLRSEERVKQMELERGLRDEP